jgi:hypothetical protein
MGFPVLAGLKKRLDWLQCLLGIYRPWNSTMGKWIVPIGLRPVGLPGRTLPQRSGKRCFLGRKRVWEPSGRQRLSHVDTQNQESWLCGLKKGRRRKPSAHWLLKQDSLSRSGNPALQRTGNRWVPQLHRFSSPSSVWNESRGKVEGKEQRGCRVKRRSVTGNEPSWLVIVL